MQNAKGILEVGSDGHLTPDPEATAALLKHAGLYKLVDSPPGLLVLRSMESEARPGGARVLVCGDIVSKTTVFEIINMVDSSNWVGELHVYGESSHRVLSFDQSALKWTSSDVSTERIGEILVARGVITAEQLSQYLGEVTAERRFGQVVVDNGYIAQEKLFENLRVQAEQVFFATLLVGQGSYLFLLPDENAIPPDITFHIPAMGLLMEGVQRIDEMELYRKRIPNGEMRPVVLESAKSIGLPDELERVIAQVDGRRSIMEIAIALGEDEFQTTKAIYQLLQCKCIEIRQPQDFDRETVSRQVAMLNEVIREIFSTVTQHSGSENARDTLVSLIQSSGHTNTFGDQIAADGGLDISKVVNKLERLSNESPFEALHQALHELVSFAMFAAASALPRQIEMNLAKRVNRRLEEFRS